MLSVHSPKNCRYLLLRMTVYGVFVVALFMRKLFMMRNKITALLLDGSCVYWRVLCVSNTSSLSFAELTSIANMHALYSLYA